MKRFLPILFASLFTGCPTIAPAPGAASCATVCAQGTKLGCVFAKPTANGASCETVCQNLKASSLPMWDLACRTSATSCAAMDLCERGR